MPSNDIPAWLNSPPDGGFQFLPVDTHAQTLPYSALTWENFERLVLRVVRREATISDCWVYGTRGQNQHGIDILASRRNSPNEVTCYQCKQVDRFSVTNIKKAVDEFLKGKWAGKAKSFILCTSLSLNKTKQIDEITKQKARLAAEGIDFGVWDGSESGQLSERLKKYPDLVDDFFLREWVRRFNGTDAAQSLGEKLDGAELADLRSQLRCIYATLFHRHDQGLRIGSRRAVPLLDRYVAPDVVETREIIAAEGMPRMNIPTPEEQSFSEERPRQTPPTHIRSKTIQEIRIPIGEWLARHGKSVILGEPGYGKSTLLRIATLQLLDDRDDPLSIPWHGLLPIWVSFGGFSAAVHRQAGLSLEDYFDQWLHQNSADATRPLFCRAVKHGEILLLLDGLDEGQDLNAAQQAIDRISAFLSIRQIPAVFTSRPRGYERVRPDGTWHTAFLAFFDANQIECYARMWFEHLEPSKDVDENGITGDRLNVSHRTSDFIKAIRANPRVMELARTPLFCQLLIDIFRHSHRLPEQRIKVYDKIVELLLSDHPASRIQAAGLLDPIDVPKAEDIREMLMRLALHIQEQGGAGVISAADCQALFCDFLIDDINGPGLSIYEAKHQAQSIVEYAQTGLGLVVEKAPNELGFFHLTIQEYLAAQAIVHKDEEEQLVWLIRVWEQPKWHEVVLAWFSIRGTEQGKGATQQAIDRLKASVDSHWARLQLLCLRTEIATSELGISPREARATIEEAADIVETTPFPELRLILARHIALGLRSSSVASLCESRISKWIPARPEWDRSGLLEALGTWQASEDLLQTFKLALHDESGRCRRAAAESLARVFASDATVGEYVATMAANGADCGVRAASLHCLWKGWPSHGALVILADIARRSMDMDLALTGIAIRVLNNTHDLNDRQRIWFMFVNGSVSYELRDFCREVLVQGWAKDEEFKRFATEALNNPHNLTPSDSETLIYFLALSWPGNSEVAHSIAKWFEFSSVHFIHNDGLFKSLFTGFRSNDALSRALRKSLFEYRSKYKEIYWGPNTKWAYSVIGDEAAKTEVLEAYSIETKSRDKYWMASTLMEAWSGDSEVRETLARECRKPPGEVAYLADWIDSFIPEENARRAWLLEAVSYADKRIVRDPVHRLLGEFQDDDCLAAVKAVLSKDIWFYDIISFQSRLIDLFPNDSEVRRWAESAIDEIEGPSLVSVATSYKQDKAIRDRLLAAVRPAKADARAEVYCVLRDYPVPAQIGSRLTATVWLEVEGAIRTSGVLARCIVTNQLSELRESFVKKLLEEVNSTGPFFGKRRRSALAGLLKLAEYSAVVESVTKEKSSGLAWFADYMEPDGLAAQTLFENWDKLREVSQAMSKTIEVHIAGLVGNGTGREAIINNEARSQLIVYLKTMPIQNRTPESLTLMAELLPGSNEMRTCLIDTIMRPSETFPPNVVVLEAQRIYAEQFGGDEQALAELREYSVVGKNNFLKQQDYPPFLYVLALGWPENLLLRPYLDQKKLQNQLPIPIVLALSAISGSQDLILACIDSMMQHICKHGRALPVQYTQSLRNWAFTLSAETFLRQLTNDPDCSRQITAMRLLGITRRLNNNDRLEMLRGFEKCLGGANESCLDGVDLVGGMVTTLPQAIFSALTSEIVQ